MTNVRRMPKLTKDSTANVRGVNALCRIEDITRAWGIFALCGLLINVAAL